MLPDVQNLMELQQADREILRLKDEIAALPKRVAVIEQKLAGTRAVLESTDDGGIHWNMTILPALKAS